MNTLDAQIISWLNEWARQSWTFDRTLVFLSGCHLLKGGVIVLLVWWAWFMGRDDTVHRRSAVLTTLLASFLAIITGRVLALTLPFRLRPIHEPTLDFLFPHGVNPGQLNGWSSFPSDHAVLFFALAAGLCLISRRVGVFALLYALVMICLPRVYLGYHYPSDILAGALIGVLILMLANTATVRETLMPRALRWHDRFPGLFYPCFFLVSYQIADMFDATRAMGSFLISMMKQVV